MYVVCSTEIAKNCSMGHLTPSRGPSYRKEMTSNKQSESEIFYSEDDSSSNDGDEPLASGSREDEINTAVILGRPKVGEPAVWQGTINLGPDTPGEEEEDDQPTTPAHQVTDMFLFEVLAKMFIRSRESPGRTNHGFNRGRWTCEGPGAR